MSADSGFNREREALIRRKVILRASFAGRAAEAACKRSIRCGSGKSEKSGCEQKGVRLSGS